jgi:tRNA (mo5U34)-methyltransferase
MAEDRFRVAAGDAGFEERIQRLSESVHARFRYHSIELPDGSVLPGLQTVEHLRWRLGLFDLPQDLHGKRVLDIGAWDGWFSFECERRGAEVVAVDCVELDTFLEAKELLGSKVEYLTLDVNELSARKLGRFDIVLFFGVLYHLRHPLLGLEKALELSMDRVLIESFVIPSEQRAIPAVMEFYERTELGGQMDNWCGPSPECLLALCRAAGFAQVALRDVTNQRASVICSRHWPLPDRVSGPAPHLHSAVNNRTWAASFHPLKDEYLCCYFKCQANELVPDAVRIEVDGFGVPSLTVTANGPNAWQANCLRPPGLEAGRHRVRMRVEGSALSNAVEFVMLDEAGGDVSTQSRDLPPEAPELCSAEYQGSGDLRIALNRGGSLICYFRSQAESLGVSDVAVDAGGKMLRPHTVGSVGGNVWQANIFLTKPLECDIPVRIRLGNGPWSGTKPLDGSV